MAAVDAVPAEGDLEHYLRLLGGCTCLDFVNSVDPRTGTRRRDFLHGYNDLITWAQLAGMLSPAAWKRLHELSEQHPQHAARVFRSTIALRELLYAIFGAIAAGEQPTSADLHTLQNTYLEALRHAELQVHDGGFVWGWPEGTDALERIGWLLTQAAIELLASPQIGRVKMCASAEGCGWLFLDTSKNGSRRWCSMEICGNRAKIRRLNARRRTTAATAESLPSQEPA